jgi:hypothetical protein
MTSQAAAPVSYFETPLVRLIAMVTNPGALASAALVHVRLRIETTAPCSHRLGGPRMVTIMPQGFPSVNIELRAPVRLELDEEDAAELIATIQADRFQ